ncbi:hypothetical protein BDN71DRAFT_1441028 [Pleurotus eryngii]|uniref:Uncharacterized protein n=1 Tax=Pleurotus eryngii TaxID=5323 RepID=A0A9P6A6N6_PLEER|nr:hypothetical protein BDN71DRAFT_1441028 [Pleurotus eryngii]
MITLASSFLPQLSAALCSSPVALYFKVYLESILISGYHALSNDGELMVGLSSVDRRVSSVDIEDRGDASHRLRVF